MAVPQAEAPTEVLVGSSIALGRSDEALRVGRQLVGQGASNAVEHVAHEPAGRSAREIGQALGCARHRLRDREFGHEAGDLGIRGGSGT